MIWTKSAGKWAKERINWRTDLSTRNRCAQSFLMSSTFAIKYLMSSYSQWIIKQTTRIRIIFCFAAYECILHVFRSDVIYDECLFHSDKKMAFFRCLVFFFAFVNYCHNFLLVLSRPSAPARLRQKLFRYFRSKPNFLRNHNCQRYNIRVWRTSSWFNCKFVIVKRRTSPEHSRYLAHFNRSGSNLLSNTMRLTVVSAVTRFIFPNGTGFRF